MRLTGSRAYAKPAPAPTMPPGLVELMEGLAKDVLKNNPENIYEFCAGHMQKLLEIRDGPPPPKKQLSLEQKIARAQEKIRQRIRDRQNQQNKNMLEPPCESQQHVDTPTQNIDTVLQPVVHGEEFVTANEVEIFHPDLVLTTTDTTTKEASKVEEEEPKDMSETQKLEQKESAKNMEEEVIEKTSSDDVKQMSEITGVVELQHKINDYETTQKGESKESTEIGYQVKEDCCDKSKDISDVEAIAIKVKDDTATQKLESKESTEEVYGDNKENIISDNEKEISEKAIVETENVVNVKQDPCNDTVVDHTEEVPQKNEDDAKIGLVESEAIVTKIDNNIEGKTITLVQDILEKGKMHEPAEVTSVQSLKNETKSSSINENENKDAIEEEMSFKKEQLLNTKHDNILIKKDDSRIEPEEPLTATNSNEIANVQENFLLPTSDDTAAEEVSHKRSPQKTETQLDESQVEPSTETENSVIKPDLDVSVNDAKLDDQVITVKIIDKSIPKNDKNLDIHDVHKNETTNISNETNGTSGIDKQIIDTDDAIPDQEHVYSGEFELKQNDVIEDDTTTVNKNKIFENYDTTENTAVSGMDLETAAITIQKVFRTFLFSKSRASTLDDAVNENSLDEDIEKKDEPEYLLTTANLNKERRTLGISRMDTVLQTVNEEKSLSLSDESSLSSAATTIQAHVRGFLVRNRLASNKTASSSSLVNSDGPSTVSLDGEGNEPKKTILNIHIVPERGQFMSRDESLLTSIDLPLDNSPPSSINLHPLGYDKSERRKQLKREDAVQSISPPSNNSGKLSEEVDSMKDMLNDSVDLKQETENIFEGSHNKDTSNIKLENKSITEEDQDKTQEDTGKQDNEHISVNGYDKAQDIDTESCDTTLTISSTAETVVDAETFYTREVISSPEHNLDADNRSNEVVTNSSSDEMDVVTPFPTIPEKAADIESDEKPKLVHSGEFHDIVVQTQVKRTESSVVREFKNVLVYFLIWDKT